MLNRFFAVTLLFVTTALSLSKMPESAIAQIPQETSARATLKKPSSAVISQSKRELIKELLEITGSDTNARQLMESMVRAELPKLVSTVLQKVPALDSDRPEVQQQLTEVVSRMASKYRDRVVQKINISQVVEQISYPIYDKYFTESELRDILGFYKSATGKKAIAILPQVVGDSMSRANEILMPKITSIMGEIIAEELLTLMKQR
ncbi:DUF2059 domain-containing protein [Pseudanabaena biceps]|nr:DUF2059 domain-containing protein [Pseudanabaena biceps]